MVSGLAAIRRWPSGLQRWLTAHEPGRTGRTGPTGALVTVAVLYALAFSLPVYAAIHYLASAHVRELAHTTSGWTWRNVLELSLIGLGTLLAVAALRREAPTWSRPTRPGARWIAELRAFGLAWLAILAGGLASRIFGNSSYPESHAGANAWPSAVNSLLAGPGEEIIVLVAPLVFLRAAKRPWWQVIVIGLALRIAYHVYYGWPAAGLLVWALAMMFLYLGTHAVVGMIVAHSYWDVAISIGTYWSYPAQAVLQFVPLVCLIIWGLVSAVLRGINRLIRRHDRKAAERLVANPAGWYQNSSGHWWWWDGQNWFAPSR
jgi:hypothetical protein